MTITAADFHGVWQLADWSVSIKGSDRARKPFGGRVEGHLIYHPEGWVSASLMELERPDIAQDRLALNELVHKLQDRPAKSLLESEQHVLQDWFMAAHGYISYVGPFDVDASSVHHRVQASLVPQWVGTTLSREYSFSAKGRRLSLSASQGDMTDVLIWDRMASL